MVLIVPLNERVFFILLILPFSRLIIHRNDIHLLNTKCSADHPQGEIYATLATPKVHKETLPPFLVQYLILLNIISQSFSIFRLFEYGYRMVKVEQGRSVHNEKF
jgi:hypothetical protein